MKKVLSSGHEVELRDTINGGEAMELKRMTLAGQKLTNFDTTTLTGDIEDLSYTVDVELRGLEMLLVSIDGNTEKPINIAKKLDSEPFQELLDIANEIRSPKKKDVDSGEPNSSDSTEDLE